MWGRARARRTFTWILGLVLVALAASSASAGPPQRWAVIVGIDRYYSQDVAPLHYAEADAQALADTLVRVAGFSPEQVFLMTGSQAGPTAPTRANIAFRLGWLNGRVGPEDTVLVFFAGHGIEMAEAGFLLPVDADARSPDTLQATGLDCRQIQKALGRLPARQVLMLIDACRSDPRADRGTSDNRLTAAFSRDLRLQPREDSRGEGFRATLFACSPGQRSYEWPAAKHGFFTHFLLQGLGGGAADAGGRVTLPSLVAYLERQVPTATQEHLGQRQVPWMTADGAGIASWVLAGSRPGAVPEVGKPLGPPQVVPEPRLAFVTGEERWFRTVETKSETLQSLAGQRTTLRARLDTLQMWRTRGFDRTTGVADIELFTRHMAMMMESEGFRMEMDFSPQSIRFTAPPKPPVVLGPGQPGFEALAQRLFKEPVLRANLNSWGRLGNLVMSPLNPGAAAGQTVRPPDILSLMVVEFPAKALDRGESWEEVRKVPLGVLIPEIRQRTRIHVEDINPERLVLRLDCEIRNPGPLDLPTEDPKATPMQILDFTLSSTGRIRFALAAGAYEGCEVRTRGSYRVASGERSGRSDYETSVKIEPVAPPSGAAGATEGSRQ